MKNILLASTSTLFGGQYLEYLHDEIKDVFNGVDEIVFIPFARPSGLSHDDYTAKAAGYFATLAINVKGLHLFADPADALQQAKGVFTGGGNTFLLAKQMQELNLFPVLKQRVESGMPYMGASAGSNIAGLNIRTTNDMPIVFPPSFDAMGLVNFNINPHYLDPDPTLKHNGETRETRILEFLTQNEIPVVGLREGSWLRIKDNKVQLKGNYTARIFEQGKAPYEVETGTVIAF
jgi:dipeptidase E